jgi:hypothetical protein
MGTRFKVMGLGTCIPGGVPGSAVSGRPFSFRAKLQARHEVPGARLFSVRMAPDHCPSSQLKARPK